MRAINRRYMRKKKEETPIKACPLNKASCFHPHKNTLPPNIMK